MGKIVIWSIDESEDEAQVAKQRRYNIFRKQSEHEPTNYETVRIDLFIGVQVASKELFF